MTSEPEEIPVDWSFNQFNYAFQGNINALQVVPSGPNLMSIPSVGPQEQINPNQIDIIYQTRHKEDFFNMMAKSLMENRCPSDPDCFFQMGRNKLLDLQRSDYERTSGDSLPFQKKCSFCTVWSRLIPSLYDKYVGNVQYHMWRMSGKHSFRFIFYSYPTQDPSNSIQEQERIGKFLYQTCDLFHLQLKINLRLNRSYTFPRPKLIGAFACQNIGNLVGVIHQEEQPYLNYVKYLETVSTLGAKDILGWWGQLMMIHREMQQIGLFNLSGQSFTIMKEPSRYPISLLTETAKSSNDHSDLSAILGRNQKIAADGEEAEKPSPDEILACSFSLFLIYPSQSIGLSENPSDTDCGCSADLAQIESDQGHIRYLERNLLDRAKILLEISNSHPPIQYFGKRGEQIQLVKFNSAERIEAYALLGDPLVKFNIDLLFSLLETMTIPRIYNLVQKDPSLKIFWESLWTDSNKIEKYLKKGKYNPNNLWKLFGQMWIPINAYQAIFQQWIRLFHLMNSNQGNNPV